MLAGFYQRFGNSIDPVQNQALHRLSRELLLHLPVGVTDIIPAYNSIYIEYDTRRNCEKKLREWLEQHTQQQASDSSSRHIQLAVHYNGADLPAIAAATGLSPREIIQRHSGKEYLVYALGFTPGFPFMAALDEALQLPRKAVPRQVPANSVAMAQAQTGIYPISTPGGWHLLGTLLEPIFDPQRTPAFLLEAGDKVRFIARAGAAPAEVEPFNLLPEAPRYPALKVQRAGLYDVLVDQGRFMVGRFGLARGGALDAPLARLANQLLGNPLSSAVLEINLLGGELEALRPLVFSLTGWAVVPVVNGVRLEPFHSYALRGGDRLSFSPTKTGNQQGARSYLALAGGFALRRFMGSVSSNPQAKIGRCLQAGDILGQALPRDARAGRFFQPYRWQPVTEQRETCLRILEGPQANPDALATLSENSYTVRSADRMGIRLDGAPVAGGDIISEAVPIGAVQVTSSGMPIILLHDRGTLGGYSKPALLHPSDLAKAAQLRVGQRLRFVSLR